MQDQSRRLIISLTAYILKSLTIVYGVEDLIREKSDILKRLKLGPRARF